MYAGCHIENAPLHCSRTATLVMKRNSVELIYAFLNENNYTEPVSGIIMCSRNIKDYVLIFFTRFIASMNSQRSGIMKRLILELYHHLQLPTSILGKANDC